MAEMLMFILSASFLRLRVCVDSTFSQAGGARLMCGVLCVHGATLRLPAPVVYGKYLGV